MPQKIAIKIDHETFVILTPEDAAALLPALCRLQFVKQEGYRTDSPYVATDYTPDFRFVPEDRLPTPPLADMVQTALKVRT